ncbi:hypothetical protein SALWKB12_0776 [Snodgrassella communis]|nr:hypothetical protein SALWKB12_0776 [Snodgrassella communis]
MGNFFLFIAAKNVLLKKFSVCYKSHIHLCVFMPPIVKSTD